MAHRGLKRGRDRAEALRDALPEAADLIAELREELREQAEPVIRAAREQVEKTPVAPKKKSRSKKPFLFVALALVGAAVAYVLLSKRDKEPAYLRQEPKAPDASPAPAPSGSSRGDNGSSPGDAPVPSPEPVNGEDVPERASAFMAGQPAQPTQAGSSSIQSSASGSTESEPRASYRPEPQAPVGPASVGYQPRAQVAAWDLPPSSVPPMRGGY
ncbi:MAG: hypothetical protein AB7F65_07290 [Dehalococcoidia bacterium]